MEKHQGHLAHFYLKGISCVVNLPFWVCTKQIRFTWVLKPNCIVKRFGCKKNKLLVSFKSYIFGVAKKCNSYVPRSIINIWPFWCRINLIEDFFSGSRWVWFHFVKEQFKETIAYFIWNILYCSCGKLQLLWSKNCYQGSFNFFLYDSVIYSYSVITHSSRSTDFHARIIMFAFTIFGM